MKKRERSESGPKSEDRHAKRRAMIDADGSAERRARDAEPGRDAEKHRDARWWGLATISVL